MEIDSKPEAMDKLDRRIIELKIEREAVKKEKDEASIKRFSLIEDEIAKLTKDYSDFEEVKHIAGIARIQLGYLKRLAQLEMGLVVDDSALAELAKRASTRFFGARPLKRAIQQQLENPLAKSILEGKFGPKETIRVACENGIMRFAKG